MDDLEKPAKRMADIFSVLWGIASVAGIMGGLVAGLGYGQLSGFALLVASIFSFLFFICSLPDGQEWIEDLCLRQLKRSRLRSAQNPNRQALKEARAELKASIDVLTYVRRLPQQNRFKDQYVTNASEAVELAQEEVHRLEQASLLLRSADSLPCESLLHPAAAGDTPKEHLLRSTTKPG